MDIITQNNLTIDICSAFIKRAIRNAMTQKYKDREFKPKMRNGALSQPVCINNKYANTMNDKDYEASLQEMIDIIDMLEQDTLPVNIFDYMPITKAGKFKTKSSIVLATSAYGMAYNSTDTVVSHVVQIKLVADKTGYNARIMFDCCDLDTAKDIVVFKDINNPINPTNVTQTAKNCDAKAGYIYENGKGVRYLYFGKYKFDNAYDCHACEGCCRKNNCDAIKCSELARNNAPVVNTSGESHHAYFKVTPLIKQILDNNDIPMTYDAFVRGLCHVSELPIQELSSEKPRKFVKEIGQVLTDEDTLRGIYPYMCKDDYDDTIVNMYLCFEKFEA